MKYEKVKFAFFITLTHDWNLDLSGSCHFSLTMKTQAENGFGILYTVASVLVYKEGEVGKQGIIALEGFSFRPHSIDHARLTELKSKLIHFNRLRG